MPVPSKEELESVYSSLKSISKTSRHYKTSNPIVRKWLIYYGIERFSHKEACAYDTLSKKVDIPDKNDLMFLYENLSLIDIRNMYNVGQETLYTWLQEHKIGKIDHGQKVSTIKKKNFDKRFGNLTKEKIEEDYSVVQCMGGLAAHYKCSMTTIKKLFKMYNIEARFAKSSVGQNEVYDYICSLGIEAYKNDRKTIGPFELDIIVPDKKLAIEYCGVYFHSETFGNKDRNYHLKKHTLCKEKGYDLITIFECEWNTKKEIVKSILAAKLGVVKNKIYARNTVFRELSYKDIKVFEEENHIQGTRPASKYYGLYHNDVLIMSLSVGKSRFNKTYTNEIIRMTTKKEHIVIGGISKIMKNANIKDCMTYADKRYGTGKGYESSGFKRLKDSPPNYFYFHKSDHDTLHSRMKFQKHKLKNADLSKSEYENMLNQGYDRIWDCGNSIFSFT